MLVMGLVLGQSLMVISATGILLMQKYLSFIMYYGSALLLFTHKVHCFDKSLHAGSLDPTCVQNFRPVPLTVFEILGFKLKNDNDNNDKKNWRNGLFAIISHVSGQFQTKF